MPEPSARASYLKETLAAVEKVDAALHAGVRARLPAAAAHIDAATPVEWLPLQYDADIVRVACELGGTGVARSMAREAFVDSVGGPRYGPIFRSAISMFGLSPATFLRVAALALRQTIRDAGALEFQRVNDREVLALWTGAPALICFAGYAEAFAGTAEGVLVVTGRKGTATMEDAAGPLKVRVTWQ